MISYNLPNYVVATSFNRINSQAGGVMILTKSIYASNLVVQDTINNFSVEGDCEVCAIKFKKGNDVFIIVGVYRAPTTISAILIHLSRYLKVF